MEGRIDELLMATHAEGRARNVALLEAALEAARSGKLKQLMVVIEDADGLHCTYNVSPDVEMRAYFLHCAIDSMTPFLPPEGAPS